MQQSNITIMKHMLLEKLSELKPFLPCRETDEYLAIVTSIFDGEGEVHHVFPESLYPQFKNEKWNLVKLSYKNHYRVHELLPFMLTGAARGSMLYAWNLMCNRVSGEFVDADKYAELRKMHSERVSKQMRENQPMNRPEVLAKFIGRKRPAHSELMSGDNNPSKRDDFREFMMHNNPMKLEENRAKFRGKNNPNYGKPLAEEQKQKLRDCKLGTSQDQTIKDKISESMLGKNTTRVLINGVVYPSVCVAAEAFGVNRHTVAKWVKSGKAVKLESQSTAIEIGGVVYTSISAAAKSLNLTNAAVKSMLKHGQAVTVTNTINPTKEQ